MKAPLLRKFFILGLLAALAMTSISIHAAPASATGVCGAHAAGPVFANLPHDDGAVLAGAGSDHCDQAGLHHLNSHLGLYVFGEFANQGKLGWAAGTGLDIATWNTGGQPAYAGCVFGTSSWGTEVVAESPDAANWGTRDVFSPGSDLVCPIDLLKGQI